MHYKQNNKESNVNSLGIERDANQTSFEFASMNENRRDNDDELFPVPGDLP